MPEEEYSEEKAPSGRAWVLSWKARDLQEIDSIFFDCDGVLVDVRDSYDSTIIETVRLLAERLMDLTLPESMPTRRSILELKRSGGFNNDWFVSYALLLGIYAYFPGRTSEDVPEAISTKVRERILSDRIKRSRTPRSLSPGTSDTWRLVDEAVLKLAGKADHTGIHSLIKILEEEGRESDVNAVKRLLGYPVEASIVGRVFDEMFYGPQLFRDKFKTEPKFYGGTGFVLNLSRKSCGP